MIRSFECSKMGEMDVVGEGKDRTAEDDQMKNFISSGCCGRRNAIPEVDTLGMDPDAARLAERLSSMNTGQNDHIRSDDTGIIIVDIESRYTVQYV